MKSIRITIVLIILFSFNNVIAQELKTHQWKNRLLLVFSKNENTILYKKQITELQKNTKGLFERKLILYHILPNKYRTTETFSHSNTNWINATSLFNKFMKNNDHFKIVLIGLDGAVKLKKNDLLDTESLFNTIDAMPMRQFEIRKHNN